MKSNFIKTQLLFFAFAFLFAGSLLSQNFYVAERSGGRLTELDATGAKTTIASIPAADGVILLNVTTAIVSRFNGTGHNIFSVNLTDGTQTPIAALGGACQGMDFDANGDLLVTNEGLDRIQKINLSTNVVTNVVTGLNRPIDVMVESGNTILYSEYALGQIKRYDLVTNVTTTLATGLAQPTDIFQETSGNLLVAENGRAVSRINIATGSRTVIATLGGLPHGIAQFDANHVLVTRFSGNNVVKLNLTNGTFTTFSSGLSNPVFIMPGTPAITDTDGDGVADEDDNCPTNANASQTDTDSDGLGDACDGDDDNDGVLDAEDNCPLAANADQANNDSDGLGDACDSDDNNDGVLDASDNCPLVANADQADADGDGVGDVCDDEDGDGVLDVNDNCPYDANASQADTDGDGEGDACDSDDDNDGVLDTDHNCALIANANQADLDGDGEGDACENDYDGDGILNEDDNCPLVANANQADNDGDGEGDLCDDDDDNDGILDACDTAPFVDNFTFEGIGPGFPTQWLCGNNNNKVLMCHVPPGNPANAQTLCVSENAVAAHVGEHEGDYLGECTCIPSQNLVAPGNGGINATASAEHHELELFPNPATGKVNIHLHGLEGEATLNVFDHLGRVVWTQQLENDAHAFQLDLNMENGIYLVSVASNGERLTKRLVITK